MSSSRIAMTIVGFHKIFRFVKRFNTFKNLVNIVLVDIDSLNVINVALSITEAIFCYYDFTGVVMVIDPVEQLSDPKWGYCQP